MWHNSSYELGDATYGTSYGPGGRSMRSSYALGALAASEEHVRRALMRHRQPPLLRQDWRLAICTASIPMMHSRD